MFIKYIDALGSLGGGVGGVIYVVSPRMKILARACSKIFNLAKEKKTCP
jgi:hypothetical protein